MLPERIPGDSAPRGGAGGSHGVGRSRPWRRAGGLLGWALLCLSVLLCGCGDAEVVLPVDTALYATPECGGRVTAVLDEPRAVSTASAQRVYCHSMVPPGRESFPTLAYSDFYRVDYQGQELWGSPDFRADFTANKLVFKPEPAWGYLRGAVLLGLALVVALIVGWRRGLLRSLWAGKTGGWPVWLLAIGTILLVRWLLVSVFLCYGNGLIVYPRDELGYFDVTTGLLRGWDGKPWWFTIGLSVFYAPFVLATGAQTFYDIAEPLTLATAYVVSPVSLLLGFGVLRALGVRLRSTWLVVMALAILPFIYLPMEIPGADKALFMLPQIGPSNFTHYYVCMAAGVNAMSDTWTMFVTLLLVWLAMVMRPGWRYMAVIGALFGYLCLVRLNAVMLAPLLAYLMFRRMTPEYRSPLQVLGYGALSVASFSVIFGAQLSVNSLQNGGWMKWPYIYHNTGAIEGFNWSQFLPGMDYLIATNYLYMVCAATGFIFLEKRYWRSLFCLWALPLLFFFGGYAAVTASPIRWLLPIYLALLAPVFLSEVWGRLSPMRRWGLALALLVDVLLVAPMANQHLPRQWGFSESTAGILMIAAPLVTAALAAWLCWGRWRVLVMVAVLLALWHAGSPRLVGGVLVLSLARAIWDAIAESRAGMLAHLAARRAADPESESDPNVAEDAG